MFATRDALLHALGRVVPVVSRRSVAERRCDDWVAAANGVWSSRLGRGAGGLLPFRRERSRRFADGLGWPQGDWRVAGDRATGADIHLRRTQ
jgi:hypothetical protein